jgi:DNA-binding CsgD family transcriptional regulator/tetratricopeptide (TPR) repeat protein
MRQMLCPVLVGREEELQVLLDAVDGAAAGQGGTFFVAGEAGVGKSRLVREVARRAHGRGLPVLTGRAVAGSVPVPFRPLAEAVAGEVRRRGPTDADLNAPELQPFRRALGRLVPEWRPDEPAAEATSPVVLGEGLLRLLRVLAGGQGCVLVLEDLHWADAESLAVLEYLADNVGAERVVCLGTLRTEQAGAGRALVGTLVDRRAARVVELARLDPATTSRLARACLGGGDPLPAAVEHLLGARADGLPFLVEELLAGLVGAGALVERDGRWSATDPLGWRVPPNFAEAVGRRLAALPAEARAVLHAAAVLGGRFDWSLLPAITGQDDAAVIGALRQAVNGQLLAAEAGGFRFRHALTRDAVVADLLPPERASIAAQALAALEQARPDLPGDGCELAAELAEAAGDGERAAALLLEAGRRALAEGALATAETTLERARRLVAGSGASTTVAVDVAVAVDLVLCDVLALAGQVDRAFELGDGLLGRLDLAAHLPSGGAELHLRLARAAVAAGRWEVAADHLAAADPRLPGSGSLAGARDPGPGSDLSGPLDALGAQVALGQGRLGDATRLAASALAVAERDGLPAVACEALEVAGRVARQRDLTEAEAAFTRELAVATAHGLGLWRLRALHELGTVDQLRTESVERLRQARDLAVEVGALALVATLDLQIAAGLTKQFRADEALAAANASVEASRRLRLATLPMALVHQAAAHAQRGDVDEMEARLAEALAAAPDDLDVQGSAWGHCRATRALLVEDRKAALAAMATGVGLLQRSPATVAPPFLGLRVLLLAVEAAGGDGDAAAAAEAEAEAERVRASGATRHRLVASLLGYADAVSLGRAGRATEAAVAVAAADAAMGPLVAWYRQYARRVAAEAALADGWGEPVAWLREAAAFFAARGDQPVAAACRALLRRAGAPVPRPGRDAGDPVPAGLRALGVTRREADVLALLAEGLTNKELAARLHLSPRTVEKHVAGLLAKTGCRRRAQLAGYSARLSG